MTKWIAALSAAALMISACTEVGSPPVNPPVAEAAVTISMDDLRLLIGDDWEGALTYLNYGSDKRSTIPVKMIVMSPDGDRLPFAIKYPGEEDKNVDGGLELSGDGSQFDNARIIERRDTPEGFTFTTQTRGQDDNRPADIRIVYEVSERLFKMRKLVKFDDAEDYIERNEYILKR